MACTTSTTGLPDVGMNIRAPQRLVGTLRRECLDHVIVMNERHLRRVLREFAAHYNDGRPHRTLELTPPSGPRGARHPPDRHRRVRRRSVLGGLTHEYMLDAA